MQSQLKIFTVIVGVFFGLSACAPIQENTRKAQTSNITPVVQPQTSPSKPTQLIVPNDKRVATAMNEALPIIKNVLPIHQCVKDNDSLRLMNVYAVPGVDMMGWSSTSNQTYPNSSYFMRYHDTNKCVSVSTLDQWTMPALNALQFRAVYIADDSGETVNFTYLFKKMDDGSWKIAKFDHTY